MTKNKKRGRIAVLCVLCASVIGFSVWLFAGRGFVAGSEEAPPVLGGASVRVSSGDAVIVNVFADELNNVYGYQFDMNYDRERLEYKDRLYSDIDEIIAIFAADKERYLLVGATMIGDAKGYSGREVPVCRVELVALSDFVLEPGQISLSRVNVVTDDLQYLENADGWTASATVEP